MSAIITSVLNTTFGLLVAKARDHTANKLKEGDLTDEKCRDLIVRELDDIKTKLDGLARKDLKSSVSFLRDGFKRLCMSMDAACCEQIERSIDKAEAVFNDSSTSSLLQAIGSLKITVASQERYESAKRLFWQSNAKATEAFSNTALSAEERILATKLRMMSSILENLDDLDAAAGSCQLYLKELHDLRVVREIFSVYLSGGMKSLFNKKKRLENVESIAVINVIAFNLFKRFTKTHPDIFSWPSVETGKGNYQALLMPSEKIVREFEFGNPVKAVNKTRVSLLEGNIFNSIVNSKEEIIMEKPNFILFTFNSTGEIQPFCDLSEEIKSKEKSVTLVLAIDRDDNIYIITGFRQANLDVYYKLFFLDSNGNIKQRSPLDFFNGVKDRYLVGVEVMPVSQHEIYISKEYESQIFMCDSTGQLLYSFSLDIERGNKVFLSLSDKNEIIAAPHCGKKLHIYHKEGKLKKTVELPNHHWVHGVTFHQVTKRIVIYTRDFMRKTFYLLSYSDTDEHQTITLSLLDDLYYSELRPHPNGRVVLVRPRGILFI